MDQFQKEILKVDIPYTCIFTCHIIGIHQMAFTARLWLYLIANALALDDWKMVFPTMWNRLAWDYNISLLSSWLPRSLKFFRNSVISVISGGYRAPIAPLPPWSRTRTTHHRITPSWIHSRVDSKFKVAKKNMSKSWLEMTVVWFESFHQQRSGQALGNPSLAQSNTEFSNIRWISSSCSSCSGTVLQTWDMEESNSATLAPFQLQRFHKSNHTGDPASHSQLNLNIRFLQYFACRNTLLKAVHSLARMLRASLLRDHMFRFPQTHESHLALGGKRRAQFGAGGSSRDHEALTGLWSMPDLKCQESMTLARFPSRGGNLMWMFFSTRVFLFSFRFWSR